jgi:hypothetical protein
MKTEIEVDYMEPTEPIVVPEVRVHNGFAYVTNTMVDHEDQKIRVCNSEEI